MFCEKWRHITESQGGKDHNVKYERRKPNWIYKFCVETASKDVIEGKIEGTGKRGRRRKEQLEDLNT